MPCVSFIPSITKTLKFMNKPAHKQLQKSLCGVWQYLALSSVLTNQEGISVTSADYIRL